VYADIFFCIFSGDSWLDVITVVATVFG